MNLPTISGRPRKSNDLSHEEMMQVLGGGQTSGPYFGGGFDLFGLQQAWERFRVQWVASQVGLAAGGTLTSGLTAGINAGSLTKP